MPTTQASDRELLVRIDERAALQADFVEIKQDVKTKADMSRVEKLERRVGRNEHRLSYICGGLIVIETLLRFVKIPGFPAIEAPS